MRETLPLESAFIPISTARRGLGLLATLCLLGGCQELSCELSSYIDGTGSSDGATSVDAVAAPDGDASSGAVAGLARGEMVESKAGAAAWLGPQRTEHDDEQTAASETLASHPAATLVHFKAVAADGWRPSLSGKLDVRVSDPGEAERLSVHGKARCRSEGTTHTSTVSVQVSRLDTWDMDFFSAREGVPFDECQIDLRLAGSEGAVHAPFGTFCYADETATAGACAHAVSPRPPASTESGLAMLDTTVKLEDGIDVDFRLQPTRNAGHSLDVQARTVCKIDGAYFMEDGSHDFDGGAFDLEPGEVYGGEFSVFGDEKWSDIDLEAATCQLTFEASGLSLYDDEEPHHFHTACLAQGQVETGVCKGFPAAALVKVEDLGPLEVREVRVDIAKPRFSDSEEVRFALDFFAPGPVGGNIFSELRCKSGPSIRDGSSLWDGTDPVDLRAGESARVWLTSSTDEVTAADIDWCELKLTTLHRDDAWAAYCWNGRKVKQGPCVD